MRRTTLIAPSGYRLRVDVATTRRERLRGLIGQSSLARGHALLIPDARSVHTFGMRFPIVAVFLDAGFRVVAVRRMVPGRIAPPRRGARHILECPDGFRACLGDCLREQGAEAAAGGKGRRRA